MKKVLMVAQHFPPAGGIGSVRVTKFVKYLREFGWEPIVLTVREDCYPKNVWLDYGFAKDIPADLSIYRTGIWNTSIINDYGIRWLPTLLATIGRVVKREKPELAYFTGGPFFPLLAGPFIKLRFGLPYVVDLRDPWRVARRATSKHGLKAYMGRILTNFVEPIVLRHAASIICVSEHMRMEYENVYPYLTSKMKVITNGYDPNDIIGILPHSFERFAVVYTGKFSTSEAFRDPEPFFKAVKLCQDRGCDIEFVHVGAIEQKVVDMAEKAGIGNSARFVGPKPHSEALSYAMGANVLLVIGGSQKTEQTGKIFDYIVCGRPILALAPSDGEIAKVSREVSFTTIIPDRDPEVIAKALEEKYCQRYQETVKRINVAVNSKYHRRNLTKNLVEIFDEICMDDSVKPLVW